MHELSIADAIYELALSHVPEGAKLRTVRVIAGPMRGIDPDAMQAAWAGILKVRRSDNVRLHLDLPPWMIKCNKCGRAWESESVESECPSGCGLGTPQGGDELQLRGIEVDDVES